MFLLFVGSDFNVRNMKEYMYEIQVSEGPFILMKSSQERSQNVSCSLILIDYDNSIAYTGKISNTNDNEVNTELLITNKSNNFFPNKLIFMILLLGIFSSNLQYV